MAIYTQQNLCLVQYIIVMNSTYISGPPVVFLHGFPEVWYSWRHQMIAAANPGFHAITPDFRGYGLSQQPPEPEKTTFKDDQEILDLVDELAPLPDWFSEEDLRIYGELYEKSGFQTALQVPYRAWEEGYGVDELRVEVPGLLIMGEKDYALKFGGFEDYITSGMVKNNVPDLETVFVAQGTHFVQEQLPNEVNEILIKFLKKHA